MINTVCTYKNVSERDMDLLCIEAFATDPDFSMLFLDMPGKKYSVISAERSKTDNGLGESDITIIYDIEGERHALLIEDKIDAPAMKNQHERYLKRAEKGVKQGEYDTFDVFVVCPEKYYESNNEAKKYENYVSYEKCRDYFATKEDVHSRLRLQQICQAIETMKSEYKVTINDIAVDSFRQYAEYQKKFFPRLNIHNHVESNKVNGWWPHFTVPAKGMYILHKTDRDVVDLSISGAAERINELLPIKRWLNDNVDSRIDLVPTGKSASFRIRVPKIHMGTEFEKWNKHDLNECFEVIQELHDLADMFDRIDKAFFKSKNSTQGE